MSSPFSGDIVTNMSFQDLRNDTKSSGDRQRSKPGNAAIAAGIFQINTAVAGFRRLVDAIGTSKDTPDLRLKLHNSRLKIAQLVRETSDKLKALSDSDRSGDVHPSKKIEDAKLARDFQAILQDYQKVQQLAMERESSYAPSAPTSALPASSSSDEYSSTEKDQESLYLLQEQKRQKVMLLGNEIAFNEAIIEEREQGIKDIQYQIGQANEIFRDLAVLVHDQGMMIDDIDSNVEGSYATTAQAKTQLVKASKSVKSRLSWCWWLMIILVLAMVIVLFVLII